MTPEDFKTWRKAMGFRSQRAAAAALGVSVQSVENWERGKRSDHRPAFIDTRTALACAALFCKLKPWSADSFPVVYDAKEWS